MEEFEIVDGKKLRCGYTTGSCAAAATKAATTMLLDGACEDIKLVSLDTPKGITLNLTVEDIKREENSVTCAICKDAGDDYDDTNGVLVYATVKKKKELGILLISIRSLAVSLQQADSTQ